MFLNRLGKLLLFIAIGAFVLRLLGMIDALPSLVGLMVGGAGLGLIVVGRLFGGPARTKRPPRSVQSSPLGVNPPTGYSVEPVYVPGQSVAAAPLLCASCQNPLRPGARFCTRCGVQAPQRRPPVAAPMRARPPSIVTALPPIAPKSMKRPTAARFFVLLVLGIIAIKTLHKWDKSGKCPWDDWQWTHNLSRSLSESQVETVPLPVAPEPGRAVVGSQNAGAYIDHAWVVTGAIDDQGYVGLGVHAVIQTGGLSDLRFAAHFRYDDSAPVYADGPPTSFAKVNPLYADPNGHAAAVVMVPDSSQPTEVTAFIPYAALSLRSNTASLQLLPSLHDSSNQPIGVCQTVPFTVYRGSTYVTRVRLDSNNRLSSYRGPDRKLLVSFHSSEARGLAGVVIVRFKDDHGMTVTAQYQDGRGAGELQLRTSFHLAANHGDGAMDDLPLIIPPGLVPPHATAEISLNDAQTGATLAPAVFFKMP